MAFADPQSLTISGTAHSLPRISSGQGTGVFQKDDTTVKLSVSHLSGRRIRRQLRVDFSKIAADVFTPTVNIRQNMAIYLQVDVPTTGFTIAEQKAVADALLAYLTASSGAKVTQLLGGEN
jgi:hypothetical protein